MSEKKTALVAAKAGVAESVISRVNELCTQGFTMPKDYNYVNAIKMSMMLLQDTVDKDKRPALEVCTDNSVSKALFKMVTQGLNAALGQGYLIVRGNQLTFHESYFGKILRVKRIYPDWNPSPRVIREGDVFEMEIDNVTSRRKLVKHVQTLESMDKDFIGGYIMLPTPDGQGDLYVMTKKQILAAWSKSSSKERLTHKQFDEKMVQKTLINSGCTTIINATPTMEASPIEFDEVEPVDEQTQAEVIINDDVADTAVDVETGEEIPAVAEPKSTPKAKTVVKDVDATPIDVSDAPIQGEDW